MHFGLFCGCRGFCHRTESDLFLFVRLVTGLSDKDVSEKLQLKTDLTLETAVKTACQSELVKSQMKNMGVGESHKNVEAVHTGKTYGKGSGFARGSQHGGSARGSHSQYRGSIQRGRRGHYTGNRNARQELCKQCNLKHSRDVRRKVNDVDVVITWITLRHAVVRVYRKWYMTIRFS